MNTNNNSSNKQATPKLVCQVTGKSRVTNQKYLAAKAEKKEITVEDFLATYICKDALRQLKAGRTVQEVRDGTTDAPTTELTEEFMTSALALNGKNGPSGPHRPKPQTPQVTIKNVSPEIEKLVQTVQEKETVGSK